MKKIIVWILLYSLSVAAVFITLANLYMWNRTQSFLIDEIREDMGKKASLARAMLGEIAFSDSPDSALSHFARQIRELTLLRTTIIDRDGRVLADSEVDPSDLAEVDNHLDRPEVQEALRRESGLAMRKSTTIGVKLFYYCEAVKQEGRIVGFIRLAMFSPEFENKMSILKNQILTLTLFLILMTLVVAIGIGIWIKIRLRRIHQALSRQRDDPVFQKFPGSGCDEIDQILNEINHLGFRFSDKIHSLEAHRQQLQTAFDSLGVGVAAFNPQGIAILHNLTFRQILGISPDNTGTLRFYDWIHFPPLIQDIEDFLSSNDPLKKRTKFYDNRYIEYQILPLIKDEQLLSGFLLTLEDVTLLQQLETIRQDFVANVTHEFKTPLTTIRGYAETLLSGSVDKKSLRQKFLKKIERQTIHLENLVSDLLQLSRMEKKKSGDLIKLNPLPILRKSIEEFESKAEKRKITLHGECKITDQKIRLKANKNLLYAIISNLVSNAIQYSAAGGDIWIRCLIRKKNLRIEVEDNGPGIPLKEQERIFERFYRIHTARFVNPEGSGLGLSIVKHSVEILSGELGINSEEGKGSLFWVELPLSK